jgi:hypothetical protein
LSLPYDASRPFVFRRAVAAVQGKVGGANSAAPPWQPQSAAGPSEDDILKLHAELKHQLALQVTARTPQRP